MRILRFSRMLLTALSLSAILAFMSGIPAYAQDAAPYDDARVVLEDLSQSLERFVTDMQEAEAPESMAEALNMFTESMRVLVPKINTIREKYPEINNEDTHPEPLKPLLARINTGFQQMMKAYAKIIEHMEHPAVKKADDDYKQVMAGLK